MSLSRNLVGVTFRFDEQAMDVRPLEKPVTGPVFPPNLWKLFQNPVF
jgi:hypothetical protein